MSDEQLDRELGDMFRASADVELPDSLIDRVASIPTRRPRRPVVARGFSGLAAIVGTTIVALAVVALIALRLPFNSAPSPAGTAGVAGPVAATEVKVLTAAELGAAIAAQRAGGLAPQDVVADVAIDPGPSDRPSFAGVRTARPVPGNQNARRVRRSGRDGHGPAGRRHSAAGYGPGGSSGSRSAPAVRTGPDRVPGPRAIHLRRRPDVVGRGDAGCNGDGCGWAGCGSGWLAGGRDWLYLRTRPGTRARHSGTLRLCRARLHHGRAGDFGFRIGQLGGSRILVDEPPT